MSVGWLQDQRYDEALDELGLLQARQAVLFAEQARVLARLAARTSRDGWQGEAPFDALLLDVAGTCVLGQLAASARLLDGEHLVVRLPLALAALESGGLRVHQAQVLLVQTRERCPAVCAQVERDLLGTPEAAERTGLMAPADLRRHVARLVLRAETDLDTAAAARRERDAVAARRVWVTPAEDGLAVLSALLPAEQAQLAHRRLTEQARHARADARAASSGSSGASSAEGSGACTRDDRTTDQWRADLLCEALDPDAPSRRTRPVQVVVHVPVATALGLSPAPADLDGHGPISGSAARRLLVGAELRRACADPVTGRVWALDEGVLRPVPTRAGSGRRSVPEGELPLPVLAALHDLLAAPAPTPLPPEDAHDPSAALARLVRYRDRRCDGIGCSVPAARCELDHGLPWPEGDTSAENLVARSQRCHHAKHGGWTATRTATGTTWTSPAGRTYRVPGRHDPPPDPPPDPLPDPLPDPPPDPRLVTARAGEPPC